MRRRAAEETIPVIITGDFNMTPYTEDHQRMQADGYIDAFQVAGRGLGYTFPNGSAWGGSWRFVPPLLRLDYVFYDAHWTALDARVLARSGGSDHYPMIATLAYVR